MREGGYNKTDFCLQKDGPQMSGGVYTLQLYGIDVEKSQRGGGREFFGIWPSIG